jgi:hypothetical protein
LNPSGILEHSGMFVEIFRYDMPNNVAL